MAALRTGGQPFRGNYFMLVIILITIRFCSSFNVAHLSNISRCSAFSATKSSSAKNWLNVMPNELQIVSSVEIVGSESLRKT